MIVLPGSRMWASSLSDLRHARFVGVDTEGWCDTDPFDVRHAHIRLIQAALPDGRCLVGEPHGEYADVLRDRIESRQCVKVIHNAYFDALWWRCALGWRARNVRCTLLLSRVYWAGLLVPHDLGALSTRAYKAGLKIKPANKDYQKSDWSGPLSDDQIAYAANDALVLIPIFQWLGKLIKDAGMLKTAQAECDAVPAFIECAYNGMPVNPGMLDDHIKLWRKARDYVIQPFKERYSGIDPARPQLVAVALSRDTCYNGQQFYTLSDDVRKKPTTLAGVVLDRKFATCSVSEAMLVPWAHYPWITALLDWRSIGVILKWLESVQCGLNDKARICSNYTPLAHSSYGRSSSAKPNLQQAANPQPRINAAMRAVAGWIGDVSPRLPFVAHDAYAAGYLRWYMQRHPDHPKTEWFNYLVHEWESKPRSLIVADYSQAHMRIAASVSGDRQLCDDFVCGQDVHLRLAYDFGVATGQVSVPYADFVTWYDKSHPNYKVVKSLRAPAKTCNYTCLNLGSPARLQIAGDTAKPPVKLSLDMWQLMLQSWRHLYTDLHNWQQQLIRHASTTKIVRALSGGRLHVLDVRGPDVVSYVWLRTEADAIKWAMGKILEHFDAHPEWEARLCNMAHDEIDIDASSHYAVDVAQCVRQCMDDGMRWVGVTVPTGMSDDLIVRSWADK